MYRVKSQIIQENCCVIEISSIYGGTSVYFKAGFDPLEKSVCRLPTFSHVKSGFAISKPYSISAVLRAHKISLLKCK